MATSAKVGAFNVNDGGANVNDTNEITVGFQPTVILFWWGGRADTTDANGGADIKAGFGWAVSTTVRASSCVLDTDGADPTNCERAASTAAMVCERNDGATAGLLDLSAISSTSFTTIIDAAFTTNLRVHYLALGGDVSSVAEGALTVTAAGTVTITGLAFQPKCVLIMQTNGSAINGSALCLGAATGPSNEACVTIGMQNNAASSDTASYGYGDECTACSNYSSNGEPPVGRATFTEFTADGFTVEFVEANGIGAGAGRYLALGGTASFRVGDFVTRTDTTQFSQSSFGFSPKAVLFASHCAAESTANTATATAKLSIGAATSATERGAMALTSEDAQGATEAWTAVSHDQVYVSGDLADGVVAEMDFVSMDADGFTTVMDDQETSASFVWYLAVGDASSSGSVGRLVNGGLVNSGLVGGQLVA